MNAINLDSPRATSFDNVEFFKVYLDTYEEQAPTLGLYSNGRQQCYIKVDFVATDAKGNQVILDPSQVRLISYSTGNHIAHGDVWNGDDIWYSSFTDWQYTWDRSGMAEAQALQDDVDKVISEDIDIDRLIETSKANKGRIPSLTSNAPQHEWDPAFFAGMVRETRRRHTDLAAAMPAPEIQYTNSHAFSARSIDLVAWPGREYRRQSLTFCVSTRANVSLALAAALIQPNRPDFTTNDPTVPNDNGMGNGEGRFNSQVIVRPVQPPQYPIESFGDFLDRHDAHWVLRDTYVWWGTVAYMESRACEQYIHLKVNNVLKSMRGILAPRPEEACVYAVKHSEDIGAWWSYCYIGMPGDTTLYHASLDIGHFGIQPDFGCTSSELIAAMGGRIVRPASGKIVIGQIMADTFMTSIFNWGRTRFEKRSQTIRIEDEFGNEHRLNLYLPDGYYKFNYVAIAKA